MAPVLNDEDNPLGTNLCWGLNSCKDVSDSVAATPGDAVCPQSTLTCHNDSLLKWPWMSDVPHSQTIIKHLLFDKHS